MRTITEFVGIDVSKDTLDIHILSSGTWLKCPNTPEGRQELIGKLPASESTQVAMEATGRYQRAIAAELFAAGFAVSVLNPRQVHSFSDALGILAKTDKIDARVIAMYAEKVRPRIHAEINEKQAELDELVTRRRQLIGLRTAEKNRLSEFKNKITQKSIQGCIKKFDKDIDLVEQEITKQISSDDKWKDRYELLSNFAAMRGEGVCRACDKGMPFGREIGVRKSDGYRTPSPPNRAGGSPAHGSPVDSNHLSEG